MALRYLAIVSGRPSDQMLLMKRISPEILPSTSRSGAIVIRSSSPSLDLAGDVGAIVGDLFKRESRPNLVKQLTDSEVRAIRDSDGERLLTGYWGGYVAFVQNEIGTVHVVRDPSATIPCLYLKRGDTHIFSSDVDLLVEGGLLTAKVDFAFLARHLSAPDIRTAETGLTGLCELMGGFRLSINNAGPITSQVWSPWTHCVRDRGISDSEISENLEEVVTGCVRAWAERYPRSLLGVSGGLDSSIVAASLVAAGADLTTVTLATNEAEGDERAFARILRDHLNIPLVEAFHRADLVDFTQPLSCYLPRPIGHAFAQSNFGIRFALEADLGIDAFFSGVGGDNVFCFTQSATALVDRFRSEGPSLGLLETLDDICRQNNASIGAVLKMALKRQFRSDPTYRFKGEMKFLGPAAANVRDMPLDHPWLHAPKGALPGKAVHIGMLTSIQGTIDGLPRTHAPQILPLLSQPIVETCLKIPMWKWVAGGRNRSVARAAFAKHLPQKLIDRQTKGGPDSFAYSVIEQNKDIVRQRLTTGRLAEEGLLDVEAVRDALDARRLIAPSDHMRLSDLSECESWVRYWEAKA